MNWYDQDVCGATGACDGLGSSWYKGMGMDVTVTGADGLNPAQAIAEMMPAFMPPFDEVGPPRPAPSMNQRTTDNRARAGGVEPSAVPPTTQPAEQPSYGIWVALGLAAVAATAAVTYALTRPQ